MLNFLFQLIDIMLTNSLTRYHMTMQIKAEQSNDKSLTETCGEENIKGHEAEY